jgi:hypothetical protein
MSWEGRIIDFQRVAGNQPSQLIGLGAFHVRDSTPAAVQASLLEAYVRATGKPVPPLFVERVPAAFGVSGFIHEASLSVQGMIDGKCPPILETHPPLPIELTPWDSPTPEHLLYLRGLAWISPRPFP